MGNLKKLENKRTELIETYKMSKEKIANNLKTRKNKYIKIIDEINTTQKQDFQDQEIELQASVVFNNHSLCKIVNKRKLSQDRTPYYDLISEEKTYNLSNEQEKDAYETLINLFQNIKSVKNNHLRLQKDDIIPLNNYDDSRNIYEQITKNTFTIDYNIKYEKDELKNMSPGKAGTVLLILYLQISSDKSPILIDQPEDNLDNRTVYDQLAQFIKGKKKDRQIIIASHNANLVVGTDSENVIVANQSGQNRTSENEQYRIEYTNGAIENTFRKKEAKGILWQQGIKEHICDILEGGKIAFEQRKKKYNF